MADKAQPEKGEDFNLYDVGNQLNIQLKPVQTNEAGRYGQHGSDTKAGQLTQCKPEKEFLVIFRDFDWICTPTEARYVRFHAIQGKKQFLFTDEIVIQ